MKKTILFSILVVFSMAALSCGGGGGGEDVGTSSATRNMVGTITSPSTSESAMVVKSGASGDCAGVAKVIATATDSTTVTDDSLADCVMSLSLVIGKSYVVNFVDASDEFMAGLVGPSGSVFQIISGTTDIDLETITVSTSISERRATFSGNILDYIDTDGDGVVDSGDDTPCGADSCSEYYSCEYFGFADSDGDGICDDWDGTSSSGESGSDSSGDDDSDNSSGGDSGGSGGSTSTEVYNYYSQDGFVVYEDYSLYRGDYSLDLDGDTCSDFFVGYLSDSLEITYISTGYVIVDSPFLSGAIYEDDYFPHFYSRDILHYGWDAYNYSCLFGISSLSVGNGYYDIICISCVSVYSTSCTAIYERTNTTTVQSISKSFDISEEEAIEDLRETLLEKVEKMADNMSDDQHKKSKIKTQLDKYPASR